MKVYGKLEVAQLEWFTDATKPAASSYPYRIIFVTDLVQIQISDGTNWNALSVGNPEAQVIVERLDQSVATLTSGQTLAVNDAVCLDLIDGKYRVMKTDSTNANRINSFIGFALNTTTATPQITTLTKSSSWTAGTETVTVNGRSYSYTYATSNDASMSALAALIGADQDVQSCTVTDNGANDNVITITSKGSLTLTVSDSQSGGAPDFTIANTQTASGSSVRVQMFGPLGGFSSLTVGNRYYVATGTGAISDTPLSSIVSVGQAISSTTMFIVPNNFDLSFSSAQLLLRTNGGSGESYTTAQSTAHHFNFSSWVNGTDSGVARCRVTNGESKLGQNHYKVGGIDTANTATTDVKSYNKSSWTSQTAVTAAATNAASSEFNGYFFLGWHSNNVDYGGGQTTWRQYSGSSWSNAVDTTLPRSNCAGYVLSSKFYSVGGLNTTGYDATCKSWNGSSLGSETAGSVNSEVAGSMQAPSSLALIIYGNGGGTATGYTTNGSSFTSVGSLGYQIDTTNAFTNGGVGGFSSGNSGSFLTGGATGASTAITTTTKWSGSSFSSSTACNANRSGGAGSVF